MLIEAGADVNIMRTGRNLQYEDDISALLLAVAKGYSEIVEILIEAVFKTLEFFLSACKTLYLCAQLKR